MLAQLMPYLAVNGLSMYYEIHGNGEPLLLLHGGASSIPEEWLPSFAPHFRVIAPEQMGHGRTADLVDRPFHYHGMAEDTSELMRRLEIESAAVVGYSDGGIIGLDLAIHHPERVTRLAVTGANARTAGYTSDNQEWIRTFDHTCPAEVRAGHNEFQASPGQTELAIR
jgi:pimeloyl-ACP methyl ester carboxylesterase